MTVRAFVVRIVVLYLVVIGFMFSHGCMSQQKVEDAALQKSTATAALDVIEEEMRGLRADFEALAADAETNPDAAAAAEAVLKVWRTKGAEAEEWMTAIREASATLDKAESGFDVAEGITTFVAGFFPPAAVAIPMIRRSKRAFEGVVQSMAAGGGPSNPDAARDAMLMVPGLKDRVTRVRVKIGDKEIKAVKATA